MLAGAGGWGDPLERDPAAVLRDVNELLSPQKALADYGVVVDTAAWTVDAATATRREEIRPARGWTETPKVQWHDPDAATRCGIVRWPVTYRAGVDIGGTFTDIVLLGSDGTVHTKKISSSTGNYAQAIVDGLSEVSARPAFRRSDRGDPPRHHGRLQRHPRAQGRARRPDHHQGLPRRAGDPHARMPKLYDIGWTKPAPLVERYLRKVVDASIDHRGRSSARSIRPTPARRRCAAGREGRGDRRLPAELVRQSGARGDAEGGDCRQGLPARSLSFEVLPEIKEYERTSTTVINAYVCRSSPPTCGAAQGLDAGGIRPACC